MKINLIYWNAPNYGDALSPRLVEELTGGVVQFKDITLSRGKRMKALLTGDRPIIRTILFPHQEVYGVIGSILSWMPKRAKVWGAGFMNEHDSFAGGDVYAVRGKLTEQKLIDLGGNACGIYGDPALLLPLWLEGSSEKSTEIALIPHWKEVDYFKDKYGDNYAIIDFRSKDVERITSEIAACRYILSSSLHGLIVAHAYGIPALWIKHGYIDTDGFKFHDYFSSVDIPLYNGFSNIDEILSDVTHWRQLFEEHSSCSKINRSLKELQTDLLKAAPFALQAKYKNYAV
ncbi:polysaccharide pyruvyl transferase family protein [Sphingobacterium suaedae]|uniref:Polysaccharide pyruvyl transferase family protein n=1 Tax=Sphingobacterium suaedae TaxID=1686402 RepID=A0ABW5KQ06_9SPHI